MYEQGRSQPNTAGEGDEKNFRWSQIGLFTFLKLEVKWRRKIAKEAKVKQLLFVTSAVLFFKVIK